MRKPEVTETQNCSRGTSDFYPRPEFRARRSNGHCKSSFLALTLRIESRMQLACYRIARPGRALFAVRAMQTVKTRFAPSPTGHLHVGGARTALYNYLIARKAGGVFLLRIEDTDRSRHDESAVAEICEDLRWLGIRWDEGIEVGGENGPYRQSERLPIYQKYVDLLLASGKAYYAFETEEELAALREKSVAGGAGFRYPRPSRFPDRHEAEEARKQGRPVVVRMVCPDRDVTFTDENFGQIIIPAAEMEDFVIQKSDGYPTFYLANAVDDALMGVTIVCRGQEFLDQTWRQVVIREALGFPHPRLIHLPLILDKSGRKLSKRDGAVDVHSFRLAGYLPEALVNFIALLGWNPGDNREKFTLEELAQVFSLDRIGRANAKFDREKLLAFNTQAIASRSPEELLPALKDYLALNSSRIPTDDDRLLVRLIKCCRGMRTFADLRAKCEVLFGPDDGYEFDPGAVEKFLAAGTPSGYQVLSDLAEAFAECEWNQEAIEKTIRGYCERGALKLDRAAQPLRIAVTGSTISPPIFETLSLLGKERTLARIRRCLGQQG